MIAMRPGRVVVGEYSDEAFSAYNSDRGPGLVEAMQHAEDLAEERDGGAEMWVQHSDRLARGDGQTARHTVEVALWALKRDVKIRSLYDPDTFRDLLYAVVTGQRNHEDSRRKSLSVQSGRKRAAARGDYIGYKPDGYRLRVELDGRGQIRKQMEIDPERELVIATAFRLALAGKRPEAITKAMNRKGWHTKPSRRGCLPTWWTVRRVMELLTNPRYADLATYGGEIVARGYWPGYITESQHRRLCAKLAKGRPTKEFRQRESYLLARLATCGLCGRRLYGATGLLRDDGTFARRYLCMSTRSEHPTVSCGQKGIEADFIEATFVSSLRLLLLDRQSHPGMGHGSYGRHHLIEAATSGEDERIDEAIERMFAEMQPQLRASTMSRRRAHELDLATQFEEWAEQERQGRTEDTRKQAIALNRLLHGWFSAIQITTSDTDIGFAAVRKATRHSTYAPRSKATVDLREWTRYAPLARRPGRRYRTWTRAEISGAIQAWTDEHGRLPRWCDLTNQRGHCPSAQTVLQHFTNWDEATQAARR